MDLAYVVAVWGTLGVVVAMIVKRRFFFLEVSLKVDIEDEALWFSHIWKLRDGHI